MQRKEKQADKACFSYAIISWPARQENARCQWNLSEAEVFPLASGKTISSNFVVWILALYFGWLLSFPLYGPTLQVIAPESFAYLSLIFTGSHAIAFFAGGVFLKITRAWKKTMIWSLSTSICVNILFMLVRPGLWPVGMALLGTASALYILGWSFPFTASASGDGHIKQMALIIILANLIFQLQKTFTPLLSPALLLLMLLGPLCVALWFLLRYPGTALPVPVKQSQRERTMPFSIILIPALFIFGLYLNSGFMYKVMIPTLTPLGPIYDYYRYIPYILALVLVWLLAKKLQLSFMAYMGVSLLGLAFVSFALLNHAPSRFFMTEMIIQWAFALLDLFCWVLLAQISAFYGYPSRIFGFGLGAMLAGIFTGDLIGGRLLLLDDSYRLVTALFAAAAIFLVIQIMPWLNVRVLNALKTEPPGRAQSDPLNGIILKIPPGRELTYREIEIMKLLLEGISNREIAGRLFISENTLKTHLKHIYQKAGVTRKRELLSMALRKEKSPLKVIDD